MTRPSLTPSRPRKPGPRGRPGRGGGAATYLSTPTRARGTSAQVCGLFPFAAGTTLPAVGTPLGRRLPVGNVPAGGSVCADPVSWFARAKLISNPSQFVLGLPGLGKALDVQTPIPTPDGMTRMGHLRPGDYVIGGDGAPVPVLAVSEVMTDRECFEMEFSTGERIVADAEHTWVTETVTARTVAARRSRQGGVLTAARTHPVTTRRIAETLTVGGKSNHAVPVMPGLALDAAPLPVHPYALGAWLGDGTSNAAQLTCDDPEILEHLRCCGLDVTATGARMRYRLALPGTHGKKLDGLQPRLRALGVLGDKHIPAMYLRASAGQRRALLAGLLDTDGTVSPAGGQVQYVSTKRHLAEDVLELIASLGFRPTIREGRATIRGRDCGPMWTVGFTTTEEVFELPRKNAALTARSIGSGARTRARYITGARRVPSRPVRCIQVAAEDGLFQVGRTFITTHNSTLVRRQLVGLHDYGVIGMVLGDLRPDYVDTVRELGGQVIPLGRGRGSLNFLDVRYAQRAAARLTGRAAAAILADAHGRRTTMASALLTILRQAPPTDREEAIVDRALRVLDDKWPRPPYAPGTAPLPRDLLRIIREGPADVRQVAIDRGDRGRYEQLTEGLEASLVALHTSARLGNGLLTEPTSEDATPTMDRPVAYDISSVPESEKDLAAALLLCCWSVGFGLVNVAHALADAGVAPRRHYLIVQDELWRPLRAGHGMAGRIDALSRLNRREGVGEIKISHTMSDLELPDPADTAMARGLVERSGMVVLGGLPRAEMDKLQQVIRLSRTEQRLVTSWTTPPAWDTASDGSPPGQGNFLIKVGDRHGIPFHLDLTPTEQRLGLHNTSRLWEHVRQVVG